MYQDREFPHWEHIILIFILTKPRVIWAFFNGMIEDSNCKKMLSIQDTFVLS